MAAVAVVFDGGSSVRRRSMASAMDYDERTRGWRKKDRQRNNQPARGDDERALQRKDDKG
jgi:hypothetical protein